MKKISVGTFPPGLHALLNEEPISSLLLAMASPYDLVEAVLQMCGKR